MARSKVSKFRKAKKKKLPDSISAKKEIIEIDDFILFKKGLTEKKKNREGKVIEILDKGVCAITMYGYCYVLWEDVSHLFFSKSKSKYFITVDKKTFKLFNKIMDGFKKESEKIKDFEIEDDIDPSIDVLRELIIKIPGDYFKLFIENKKETKLLCQSSNKKSKSKIKIIGKKPQLNSVNQRFKYLKKKLKDQLKKRYK